MIRDTTYESFRAAVRAGTVAPVVREFAADTLTPVGAFAAVRRPPFGFLLESLVGGERWARYTFLGTEPREVWRYRAGRAAHWSSQTSWRDAGAVEDPLAHISARVRATAAMPTPGLPRFTGGAVGYLGYDAVRAIERLPSPPPDDLGLPDAVFMIADTVVIFDNAFGRAIVVANAHPDSAADERTLRAAFAAAEERIEGVLARLQAPPRLAPLSLRPQRPPSATSPYAADAFLRGVEQIKAHIRAGDVYQAVLSRRLDLESSAPPLQIYRALRALNPAPYLFYLALDDMAIAGSSPEVLVRVADGEVLVRPIAGTRPRGSTPEDDEALGQALLTDPKELAEHMMLVDLGRNDVGRTAEYGSVRLTADKVIERYSHVQHIVSEVRGRLRSDRDAAAALEACFPAGTVSGAPKLRAMEILDRLEPTRRGPYAGAVGYLGWGAATLDTAIAIRTAVLRGKRAWVQAGAGIVADSVPERELEETERKAGAVVDAIGLATAGSHAAAPDGIFTARGPAS